MSKAKPRSYFCAVSDLRVEPRPELITGQTAGLAVIIAYSRVFLGVCSFDSNLPFYFLCLKRPGGNLPSKSRISSQCLSVVTKFLALRFCDPSLSPALAAVIFGAAGRVGRAGDVRQMGPLGGLGRDSRSWFKTPGVQGGWVQLIKPMVCLSVDVILFPASVVDFLCSARWCLNTVITLQPPPRAAYIRT